MRITAMFPRLLTVVLLAFPFSAVRAEPASKLLWLSDIHFDPFANSSLVDKLALSPVENWPDILSSTGNLSFAPYGHDTNWPLLSSALRAIRYTLPKPAFAIVTGDLLAHHFHESFARTATDHSDTAYRQFVAKTYAFVSTQLQSVVPDGHILLALGNNDDVCGDYMLEPEGPFLHDTTGFVAKLAGVADDTAFRKDWNALGSFNAPNPTVKHHRVLSLNTNFFSPKYANRCGSESGDPGNQLLNWLEQHLAEAEHARKKIWLIYHMPPGIDGFATSRNPQSSPVLFWKSSYTARFESLLKRYGKSVQLNFAGHTHDDDFRLIGRSKFWVGIEPALSPVYNQNPAFRIVDLDANGAITNESTYFLDLSLTDANPGWRLEYQFDQAWGFRHVNAAAYRRIWHRAGAPGRDHEQWMAEYSVQHKGKVITEQTFRAMHCASGYTSVTDYQACAAINASRH